MCRTLLKLMLAVILVGSLATLAGCSANTEGGAILLGAAEEIDGEAGNDVDVDGDGEQAPECPDCICDCGDDCCDGGDITVTCECEAEAHAECNCCDCCDKDDECVPTHDVEASCSNGIDEDCDGLIDCDDPDCDQNPICCEDDVDSDCDGIGDGCDDCPEMYNPEQEGCPEFCDEDSNLGEICHRESEEDPGVTLCVPFECVCCDNENGADNLAKTSEILIPECDAHEMHEYDTFGDCDEVEAQLLKDYCNPEN